jgi:hypothetical protein
MLRSILIMAVGAAGTVAGIVAMPTAAVSAVTAVSPIMAEAVTMAEAGMAEAAAGMVADDPGCREAPSSIAAAFHASSTQLRADWRFP